MIGFIGTSLQSLLITINYSAIANLPTSESLGHAIRFLATDLSQELSLQITTPFLAAANSEDSTQFSSDYCSVLLHNQLRNSPLI
jgi:hypothetical protein